MNAVANKPRSKASAASAKPSLEKRLVDIDSRLALGRKKLALASEAVEQTHPGEAVDVLLLHVIERMLPDAIFPLHARPITAEAMDAAYTGMFPSLAAIEGVISLAAGQAIEPFAREAFELLNSANSDMDFGDMPDALPMSCDATTTEAMPAPIDRTAHRFFDGDLIDPYCVMNQALNVMRAAVDESAKPTDMHWGVFSLIEHGVAHVERAQAALDAKAFSEDLHDKASSELAGLIGVLHAVNTDAVDNTLIYAVETLVTVAKAKIDSDNEAFMRGGRRA
ncbi:MAG: hypothetical protein Q7T70_02780 [Polaromonas sp.]|nr:hypothetical protein [Polaromonas sp.]